MFMELFKSIRDVTKVVVCERDGVFFCGRNHHPITYKIGTLLFLHVEEITKRERDYDY